MTEPKDPPRLLEPGSEASDDLRRLFENAERDLPSTADLARLEAKLGPLLDVPPAAPPPSSGGPLAKLGLGLLGGGVIAAGLWFATRPGEPPPAPPPEKTQAPIAAPAVPSAPRSTATETPSAAAEPAAPLAPEPSAAPTPGPAPAKRTPAVPEDQLLEQARSALRSNPERALSLARQHQLDFPRGVLSQEREVIAIEALRRLGRTEEAARRTERFERLYPQSAHQRKLDAPQRGQ